MWRGNTSMDGHIYGGRSRAQHKDVDVSMQSLFAVPRNKLGLWAQFLSNIATKFCMLTELGEQNCYEIHHHPIPAAAPSDFWDPLSTTMRFDLDRPNVNGNTSGRVIF